MEFFDAVPWWLPVAAVVIGALIGYRLERL